MPRSQWLNPATRDYQARRWARRQEADLETTERVQRGPSAPTPDPGSQTDSIRVDPSIPGVAFVVTSVAQSNPTKVLTLYSSTLVRTDPVNPAVAWLTVTEVGA